MARWLRPLRRRRAGAGERAEGEAMAKVGLVFGGRSVEHLVSVVSARTVRDGLLAAGHQVVPLGVAEDGCWVAPALASQALDGELDALPPQGGSIRASLGPLLEADVEVIFPITHGTFGEDGTLQGLLEMLDLPYVGANVAASAVAMDKVLCKRQLEAAGIPVVEYEVIDAPRFAQDAPAAVAACAKLGFPAFVKPAVGGSSVGIRRAQDEAELADALAHALSFHDVALVERAVSGRELECAVLGRGALEASVVGEIVPGNDFYDYEDKYVTDGATLVAPAELEPATERDLKEMATRAFAAVGGDGMARVDFFLEGDKLFINEINTLPGFTAISMYPRLWGLSGLPLPKLCDRLVTLAQQRHSERARFDGAIRDWVAELSKA
jgi:D-alanine-D-alanine ligase